MLDRFTHLFKNWNRQKAETSANKTLFGARHEVEINGNGTNGYVIKTGANKGKVLGHTTRSKSPL